jgi:hypothetical protein
MKKIDILLKTPYILLSIEEKLKIKRLDAYEPRDFKVQQNGKNQNMPFSTFCFNKKTTVDCKRGK